MRRCHSRSAAEGLEERTRSVPAPKVGMTPSWPSWSVTSQIQPEENMPRTEALKLDLKCAREP